MSASGMYQRLASAVSNGTTSVFSFQNIPVSGYSGLVVVAKVRQQVVSLFPYWYFYFNGDTSSNVYNGGSLFMSGYDYGAQSLGSYVTGDTLLYIGRNPEGTTSGDPRWALNSFQYFHMFISNAGSSTQLKTARISNIASNNISTPYSVSNSGITYRSTNPVTRIDVGMDGGNWAVGTEFIVYGYGPQ
jgi:hypothetical protein